MWFETEIRVRYVETDQMGIVHHSNYFPWFEIARGEFLRDAGLDYRKIEEDDGFIIVVVESWCRNHSPAHYDDLITVKTKIANLTRRTIDFEYEVIRKSDDRILAKGKTKHVLLNSERKIQTLPEKYRKILKEIYA